MNDAIGAAEWFSSVANDYPELQASTVAIVRVGAQQLSLFENGQYLASYPVSTSRYGVGNRAGSEQTPLGLHYIRKKIGGDSPPGTVFRARRNTGERVLPVQQPLATTEDFITSRILWLSGLEPGKNVGEDIDSFSRYIYIHGTHEEGLIGQPASHGCIRMKNDDVIELYDQMPETSLVMIVP